MTIRNKKTQSKACNHTMQCSCVYTLCWATGSVYVPSLVQKGCYVGAAGARMAQGIAGVGSSETS